MSTVDIANFAHVLHENGDKILNGSSKLSVNASLLHCIGDQLNSLTSRRCSNESVHFEVLPSQSSRSKTIENLQFLHDFFQKTSGLKIVNNANTLPVDAKLDVSKFKKLKYLELKRVPVKQLVGLKVIQHQMECIVCERGLTTLEHLLAECGGDNSTGFVWSELKEAVFSFNDIKVVDSSVAFAPWLQVLDLSHNKIVDVNAIERLPNLKYVNISYNSLTSIPIFNKSARKKMEVLILKSNFIDDLKPLSGLDCLRELDLSNNFLCNTKSFDPLLSMSLLHWLSFKGNPICEAPKYRLNVVKNLHISASFGKFTLDGVDLSKKEREFVGIELSSSSTIQIEVKEEEKQETVAEKPRRKSGKVRVAVIPNIDGTYEDLPPEAKHIDLSGVPNLEHVRTKEIIGSLRATHGDDWLRAKAADTITNLLGLPNTTLSSTPYDDSCLDALIKDVPQDLSNTIVTTAVIEPVPQNLVEPQNGSESFFSCKEDNSNYFSLETSTEITKKETSPDVETIVDSEEERGGREDDHYLAVRITRDGSEIRREELFLLLTDEELREVNINNGRTIGSWSLQSLENVTILGDCEVQLIFDTIRRDRRERNYELDVSEFKEFCEICQSVMSERLGAFQTLYHCMVCSAEFSLSKKGRKDVGSSPICPSCGSKVTILAEDANSNSVKLKQGLPSKSHNRSASVGICSAPKNSDISKCPSGSSLGSLSDDRRSVRRKTSREVNKRSDSDIEIMSNPSQSSIEVIEAPPLEEESKQSVLLDEKLLTTVATFTGLTESSSSGSVTDSICTAYENSSMIGSGFSKKSGQEVLPLIEEPVEFHKSSKIEDDFKSLLNDVIEKVGEKVPRTVSKEDKDVDRIEYSFTNFSELDHRIKLFVYAHLFEDNLEEFSFLLRCQVLTFSEEHSFNCCLVFSNLKMYALRITGEEEGEEVSKFFQKVDTLCLSLNSLQQWKTLSWNEGFIISYRSGYDRTNQFVILLKDPARTLSFLKFIKNRGNLLPKCEFCNKTENEMELPITQYLISNSEDPTFLSFNGFLCCRFGAEDVPLQVFPDGAIFITQSCIYIIDSLKWLIHPSKFNFQSHIRMQKISDLIQAGVFKRELRLQFLQETEGKQEVWCVTFVSDSVLQSVLAVIKTPWERLFSVPLEISNVEDSLGF